MTQNGKRDRFDALAPRDVATTLRSLERRFGSVRKRALTPRLAAALERPGPTGLALDILITDAARGAALVASALDRALDAVEPVVAEAVLDPTERVYTDERGWTLDAAVDVLAREATSAADRIDKASADALSRAVTVTGGGATTPLAVAQQLARELIDTLTASERHIEWLESQA